MAGAEGWAGFTQEELRRLQRGTECGRARSRAPGSGGAGRGAVRCSQQALALLAVPISCAYACLSSGPLVHLCLSSPCSSLSLAL